jgi:hypothetical protein
MGVKGEKGTLPAEMEEFFMEYFIRKKDMIDRLNRIYEDEYNYNIKIKKEKVSINGVNYWLWGLDCRRGYIEEENLEKKNIDDLLCVLEESNE